jgi:hypothetical protein
MLSFRRSGALGGAVTDFHSQSTHWGINVDSMSAAHTYAAASKRPSSLFLSLSLLFLLLKLRRIGFRLNGGFVAGFRRSILTVSHSLPTEWLLRTKLSTESIWLLCSLSFCLLFIGRLSACSLSLSLSLPNELRRGEGFRRDPFGLSALSPFRYSLSVACSFTLSLSLSLPNDLRLRSRLSTGSIRIICSLSLSFSSSVSSVSSD